MHRYRICVQVFRKLDVWLESTHYPAIIFDHAMLVGMYKVAFVIAKTMRPEGVLSDTHFE
jgi:hypothetical protein